MRGVMMLSRGLRRVPLDFEHPKRERYDYRTVTMVESFQPVFDEFYVPKVREWLAEREAWQAGERPDWFEEREGKPYTFEEYNDQGPDPPEPALSEREIRVCLGCGNKIGTRHRADCPYAHPWPRDKVDHVQTRIAPIRGAS